MSKAPLYIVANTLQASRMLIHHSRLLARLLTLQIVDTITRNLYLSLHFRHSVLEAKQPSSAGVPVEEIVPAEMPLSRLGSRPGLIIHGTAFSLITTFR